MKAFITACLAAVVLAADGLAHASLRDCTEFTSRVARDARIGLGAAIVDYPPAYAPGTIFMAVGRLGYVGLVRVEDGLLNIAAALAPDPASTRDDRLRRRARARAPARDEPQPALLGRGALGAARLRSGTRATEGRRAAGVRLTPHRIRPRRMD